MNFASNLRYLRKTNCLSQEELADRLGYKSFTTIQKWESGVSEPSVSVVKTIAEMFNLSMDALINANLQAEEQHAEYTIQDEPARHLLSIYHQLNADGQQKILDYAEDLADLYKYQR